MQAPPGSTATAPPKARRIALFVVVAVAVLALDIVSKLLVVANLPETHQPLRLIGGALYLNQARNSGAAFSLGAGFTVILTAVALAVVVFIVRTARRMRSRSWAVALGLVLGGALGNLVDRLFRAPGVGRGHVVDWISVFGPYDKRWPIFNLADSAIVCGAILAALIAIAGIDIDGGRTRARHE
ncbi:signal peptidase II [uncultured Jatrophihabitans sp.]|uniref:signal peptidase II n=1 Tax=uncultured Jatrophihabitans sp. TaxID=1610747 RepID=UPI0035C99170